jgi:hypothetical protein
MVSLLEMLEVIRATKGVEFQVVALDPNESRRTKMIAMVNTIYTGRLGFLHNVVVTDLEAGKNVIKEWTGSLGCNAVLEAGILDSHF